MRRRNYIVTTWSIYTYYALTSWPYDRSSLTAFKSLKTALLRSACCVLWRGASNLRSHSFGLASLIFKRAIENYFLPSWLQVGIDSQVQRNLHINIWNQVRAWHICTLSKRVWYNFFSIKLICINERLHHVL